MRQQLPGTPSLIRCVLYGVIFTALAVALRWLFDPIFGNRLPYITYFLAVALSSWLGGLIGGLTSLAGSCIVTFWWTFPSLRAGVSDRDRLIEIGFFILVAGIIVALSDVRMRQNRRIVDLLAQAKASAAVAQSELGARLEFEAAHQQLAAIVASSGDAIFSRDLQGKIVSWNEGAEHLFGYQASEVIGRPFEVLVEADQIPQTREFVARVERGETLRGLEVRRVRKDGSIAEVSLTISPIFDPNRVVIGVSAVARDISERKLTEKALAESEGKFRAVAETATTAIYIHDGQRIIYVNPAAERITGYSRDELYQLDLWTLVHPDFREMVKQRAMARFQGLASPDRYEYKVLHKQGQEVWLDFGATAIEYEGKRCILANAFDVTSRKLAEEALIRSEKLASAGRLAATIAHEINNPLEAVTNLLYLARTDSGNAPQYIAAAESELHRVAHIARQTLGFYRDRVTPQSVNLEKLVRDVLALYEKRMEGKNITVKARFEKAVELVTSSGEVRQVLSNLISNAVDALPSDGKLSISARHTHVPRAGVRIVIADNAGGIPPELRSKIFEAFFTTKRDVGTGLGLWVTRNLVEKNGGSLRMRSSTHPATHGTVFSVFLPAEQTHAEAA